MADLAAAQNNDYDPCCPFPPCLSGGNCQASGSNFCGTAGDGRCANFCGGVTPNGCWCDDACFSFDDCCSSYFRDCKKPTINLVNPTTAATEGGVPITVIGGGFGAECNEGEQLTFDPDGTRIVIETDSWTAEKIVFTLPGGYGFDRLPQVC